MKLPLFLIALLPLPGLFPALPALPAPPAPPAPSAPSTPSTPPAPSAPSTPGDPLVEPPLALGTAPCKPLRNGAFSSGLAGWDTVVHPDASSASAFAVVSWGVLADPTAFVGSLLGQHVPTREMLSIELEALTLGTPAAETASAVFQLQRQAVPVRGRYLSFRAFGDFEVFEELDDAGAWLVGLHVFVDRLVFPVLEVLQEEGPGCPSGGGLVVGDVTTIGLVLPAEQLVLDLESCGPLPPGELVNLTLLFSVAVTDGSCAETGSRILARLVVDDVGFCDTPPEGSVPLVACPPSSSH